MLKARKFAPVYVLMGDEPFYIDKICDYIAENGAPAGGAGLQPDGALRGGYHGGAEWWTSVRAIR